MSILVLPSRVHAVTVYRQGALVTRRAALARADGAFPRNVRLTDLPLALDDGSVRARVLTPDGAAAGLAATELHVGLDAPAIAPITQPPDEQELDAARAEEGRLAALISQLDVERAALDNLAVTERPAGPDGGPPPAVPTQARLELIALRAREAARVATQRRELAMLQRAASERRADLEARRARASTAQPAREDELRKTVLIALADGGGDGEVVLDVQYLVPGARWAPAYALELSADHRQARLSLRALVKQATGEDWPGAKMTFSTALPQAWTELPELTSLRIGRRQSYPAKRGWVPPPTGADELYRDFDAARRPPPAQPAAGVMIAQAPAKDAPDELGMTTAGAAAEEGASDRHDRKRKMARAKSGPMPPAMSAPSAPMMEAMPRMAPGAPAPEAGGGFISRAAGALFGDDQGVRDRLERLGSLDGSAGTLVGGAPRRPPPPPVSPELAVGRDLLDFGRLRMFPAGSSSRGALRRISEADLYMELLASFHLQVVVDVHAVVRARSRADMVGEPLPPRHEFPNPVGGFDYAYPADFPLDVPSDGTWHSIVLGTRDGTAELNHVCVPRESSDVFREIALANPLDAPLLDGPVDVIVAGEFRMTARVQQVPPRGKLVLGLGTEPAIKVARNTTFREETTGMMGGSLALEHEIRVEAISHLPGRTLLEVRERVPVVREGDEAVTVVLRDAAPPWLPYEQRDPPLKGGHVWRIALEPGKKETLRARYGIEIAAKNELVGGNRREA